MTAPAPLLLILACSINIGHGGTPEEPVEAIWRVERVELTYASAHVHYTCGALERKIRAVLQALGAHERMSVQLDCAAGGGGNVVRSAHAQVTLAIPVLATEENVRVATTFDSRARLIARVQKRQLPTSDDIELFPAAWQTVALFRKRSLGLDAGDCDLLRNMREQIFPKLPVRVVRAVACASGTRVRPTLEVGALIPLPAPDDTGRTRG